MKQEFLWIIFWFWMLSTGSPSRMASHIYGISFLSFLSQIWGHTFLFFYEYCGEEFVFHSSQLMQENTTLISEALFWVIRIIFIFKEKDWHPVGGCLFNSELSVCSLVSSVFSVCNLVQHISRSDQVLAVQIM